MGTPTEKSKLSDLRKPYNGITEHFDVKDLVSKEPFGNFNQWFELACNCSGVYEPNAMTVATATLDGKPSVRVVLMKGYDNTGFKFFTNYNSRKGKEMAENPNASLMFYWEPLKKMVRIEGNVEKLSDAESETYFQSRPRISQFNAAVSDQSSAVASREVLLAKRDEMMKLYADDNVRIPKPEHWGGFRVCPTSIEFWQGQSDRLHDRIRFRRPLPGETIDMSVTKQGDDGWVYERLCP